MQLKEGITQKKKYKILKNVSFFHIVGIQFPMRCGAAVNCYLWTFGASFARMRRIIHCCCCIPNYPSVFKRPPPRPFISPTHSLNFDCRFNKFYQSNILRWIIIELLKIRFKVKLSKRSPLGRAPYSNSPLTVNLKISVTIIFKQANRIQFHFNFVRIKLIVLGL